MKKLILKGSLTLLAVVISGCVSPSTPTQVNASLPTIQNLKTISDMTEIGFEWTPTPSPEVAGYYLYRSNPNENNGKMKVVADIKDRFASHHVDSNLAPETTYSYEMRTYNANKQISNSGVMISASTKALMDSVPFVRALTNLPERVKLIWRPHPDLRVASYIVEKADIGKENWRQIAEVKGRLNAEYIDDSVKSGRAYKYRVFVKTSTGTVSKPSAIVDSTTKPLPSTVTNIQASNNTPKKIILTWDSVASDDFGYYKIYSASNKFLPYTYLAKTKTNSYEDLINENGATRYYKITIVDKDGLESKRPEEAVVGSTLAAIEAPVVTSIVADSSAVKLQWSSSEKARSYTVIREGGDSGEQKFTNITGNEFIDTNVAYGLKYTYRVIAVDEYGINSDESKKASVSIE
ncbi:fibronectin type III domain-containing protein [Campylobacter sp. CCUG 57310]|uniref:fibronectin type III domain-containing protein n=1 Tax=Campylobacter sp. CCUG 57310 TaxID=2517362 RepID=UPI0015639F29|nr:fibronectin type III domain-containing protein [Campylobacter sp. CCUG 57310]QKF92551.1 fibronectin type III domain-containing protein [Campylobacter sp. CCUG 57310]